MLLSTTNSVPAQPRPNIEILNADCRIALDLMPAESVDCVVTSPPYWGLRDYGVPGQLGLEASLGEHLEVLVAVFREVRRVLKKTGTCWVNYGDAYASAPNGRSAADTKATGNDDRTFRDKPISTVGGFLKPKDRMLLPARLAIALQKDGWWLRDEIIWHKPNPMPSSVKDRTTPAHEMIYMFSKAPRYFYDQEAIRNPPSEALLQQVMDGYAGSDTKDYDAAGAQSASSTKARIIAGARKKIDKRRGHSRLHAGFNDRWDAMTKAEQQALGSNKRSVWTVPPKPFAQAHFATFPPDLIKPCILAGCPSGGLVLDPFFGAGTTGLVAQQLGCNCIGIELSADYTAIARARIAAVSEMTTDIDIFA